jgi:chromosome segregation ATPase
VSKVPARKVAAAGTAVAGFVAAAAAYVVVGGFPGLLYAGGIVLAAVVGAIAILAGHSSETPEKPEKAAIEVGPAPKSKRSRWARKSRVIAELEVELASTSTELEEHRQALANLGAQMSRESEAAHTTELQLEQRIRELETERNKLHALVAEERGRFEQTLNELGGGIGRHGDELAELERELEALIAR